MALGTQEEQRRLSVFENMVLRIKLRPKGKDVNVILRRLHHLYPLLCIIALVESRIMKCVVQMLEILFANKTLIWK
jgi:hypothetical protein